jgi:hypothetical protein
MNLGGAQDAGTMRGDNSPGLPTDSQSNIMIDHK